MAALRDIKKRIRSVKSSQKITRAMKLVAASKLRRAQDAILQARPYAEALSELVGRLVALDAGRRETDGPMHPWAARHEGLPRHTTFVVIGSSRGSCGAFNTGLFRRCERMLRENAGQLGEVSVMPLGRKAREYFARRKNTTVVSWPEELGHADLAGCQRLATALGERFVSGSNDQVFLLYNRFKSAMVQEPVIEPLLPIEPAAPTEAADQVEPLCEPSLSAVAAETIPKLLTSHLWRALLESQAAEHAARMTAMDAATNNAQDLVESYTLQYNRARQAAITLELMDIVGGAEALAG